MHNYFFVNNEDLREDTALILTLATFFFNHNNINAQEDFHNDFSESNKD